MNQNLLAVLDSIERDKGIKKEILITAIESALISAARKSEGKFADVKVEFDQITGDFKVFSAEGRDVSVDFGRIAAQTAKQVIIQKIREAERDVVFEEYLHKINDIASGAVHRFDKGVVIVDLGRVEGILPKKEIPPNEEYNQGDRIKAVVVEVRKGPKGPQIMLSRSSPALVKRLFELEVPEIYEGIVEIKSVSREAGARSKIAVYSKDDKVDPVGACVGMRGQRVKNIVGELGGEKIDIVRWSVNLADFVAASLSPAEILTIRINEADKKAEVIVADDQLSLAIGKKGQNVRLAAKLTGWNIDIRSKSEIDHLKEIPIGEVEGVGPKMEKELKKAGIDTVGKVVKMDLKELTGIKGIGKSKGEKILQSAKEIMEQKVQAVRVKESDKKKPAPEVARDREDREQTPENREEPFDAAKDTLEAEKPDKETKE